MLYSTIIVALIIFFSVTTQLIIVDALKNDGNGVPVVPKIGKKREIKQPEMSENEKRTLQILANIDNYNGSEIGQVEIKE